MDRLWMAMLVAAFLWACSPQPVSTVPLLTAPLSSEAQQNMPDTGIAPLEYRAESWRVRQVSYRCAGDEELQLSYLGMDTGESFAVLYYDGRLSIMRSWAAASGVRYLAIDEQNSYRWYSQGEAGLLAYLAADHTATEEIVLADCVAQNPFGRVARSADR